MIRLNSKIKKKLNRNGFVIIKDFFNEYQKSQLKIFADNYAKNFILSWSKKINHFILIQF